MVFCHEWVQTQDGMMEAVRLKDDLSAPEGSPKTLFHASDAPWVKSLQEAELHLTVCILKPNHKFFIILPKKNLEVILPAVLSVVPLP